MRSRHISLVVNRSVAEVYAFAANPDNTATWAAGLARGPIHREGDTLVVASPMGDVTVRFAPPNDYEVLDHDVTLPAGEVVTNPLRVVAHPNGSEVIFTLRQRDLSDAELDRDAEMVRDDLARLKSLLEESGTRGLDGEDVEQLRDAPGADGTEARR